MLEDVSEKLHHHGSEHIQVAEFGIKQYGHPQAALMLEVGISLPRDS